MKGLARVKVDKNVIENAQVLAMLAREGTESDDTETEGESDEESSIENSEDEEEETESRVDEGYRKNCDQCENGVINLVCLASCPKCSWKDFYDDVHHQLCKLCGSTSPLNATHYIVSVLHVLLL